jgi:hypothetical protein
MPRKSNKTIEERLIEIDGEIRQHDKSIIFNHLP